MYKRFSILTTISKNQPVGRRSLSEHMDMTERVLRSETDMLKKQDLIKVKPTGMEITAEGEQLISQLKVTLISMQMTIVCQKVLRINFKLRKFMLFLVMLIIVNLLKQN